ncbi:MAG: acylphosphatase [Patescibacteria group bacterium]|nr:acylphosphatase [Patescibacteria group bacterium]
MKNLQELHCEIRGRVQGVFFRDFVAGHARKLNVVGYVRNRPDGSVEFVAQGARDGLERLLAEVREGPEPAEVSYIKATWRNPSTPYATFRILG